MIRTPRNNSANKAVTGINITPFTDVCLVLLIIFLLTATDLNKTPDKGKPIELPAADLSTTLPAQPIIIEIDESLNLFLNDKLVSFSTLSEELKTTLSEYKNYAPDNSYTVVIKAYKGIPYEHIITAMDLAQSAGNVILMLAVDDGRSNNKIKNDVTDLTKPMQY